MSQNKETKVIQIHKKGERHLGESDQISHNYHEPQEQVFINMPNKFDSQGDGDNNAVINMTNANQSVQIEEDQLQKIYDDNGLNLKEQASMSDEEDQRKVRDILQKPGIAGKGYVLYSDRLMEKLIKDKHLSNPLLDQFKAEREPLWAFGKEELGQIPNIEEMKVLCITWNMHGNMPQLCTNKLLRPAEIKHHIIVVSTQECQRSIPMSFFCENKQKWEAHLTFELGNQYVLVKSLSMNALHLGIFMHTSVTKYVTAISTDCKATGIANIIGNKGGIGISMEIAEKSFLFINSHFSSGQNNNPKRNSDYKQISESLNLPKYYSNPKESLFKRFHYIFWMGDFNYRIEAQKKVEVDQLLKDKQYFELLKRDQLMTQKKIGKVFLDFSEGLILFPPSYKMLDSENKYSQGSDERIPGWTDRIFFKQKNPNSLTLLNYEMALDVFGSDHRPVFAQFIVKAKFNENFKPIPIKESAACRIF